jgi:ferredoxin
VGDRQSSADRVRVTIKTPSGAVRTIEAAVGSTLMEAAVDNGIEGIIGECGGSCACATCHVKLTEEWFERSTSGPIASRRVGLPVKSSCPDR